MKFYLKIKIAALLLLLQYNSLQAQDNYITLDTANGSAFVHGIAEVLVVDKREHVSDTLGIIRAGKMNGKRALTSKLAFTTAIENYYKTLSLRSKNTFDKKLIVLIYKFEGNEIESGYTDENAQFVFSADYFISNETNTYQLLGMIDTVINVHSLDVTKKLLRTIDQSLCSLYEYAYTLKNKDKKNYDYEQVLRYAEIEKAANPAYQADTFCNGLYATWSDFLALRRVEGKQIGKKNKRFKIEYINEKGKTKYEPLPIGTKVIAYEGNAYINFGNICYPISKRNNDFYFTGKLTQQYNDGLILGVGIAFGAIGVLMFVDSKVPIGHDGSDMTGILYEFKIDPRKGKAILLRKIEHKGAAPYYR